MGVRNRVLRDIVLFKTTTLGPNLNPYNDKEAYRIGQQNDVDVIKLISKGTIEEDIIRLVEALAAAEGAAPQSAAEKQIKASLVEFIKRQRDAPVQRPSQDVKADEDDKEKDGADDLRTKDEDE